jgi:hypothetical protein
MKKISTIFLISLTLLTFNNTASAGFFGDIFKDIFGEPNKNPLPLGEEEHTDTIEARCMVEYTQLDLSTGLEKNVKHTVQYVMIEMATVDDVLHLSAQDLTDKINIWLNKSPNNIITNLTIINCKEKKLYINQINILKGGRRWGEYKGCPDEFNILLMDWLERPKQWGYNVHKERLIKDYEDGCKNIYSRWK